MYYETVYINLPNFGLLIQANVVNWVLAKMALRLFQRLPCLECKSSFFFGKLKPSTRGTGRPVGPSEVPVTKENIDMAISKAQGTVTGAGWILGGCTSHLYISHEPGQQKLRLKLFVFGFQSFNLRRAMTRES